MVCIYCGSSTRVANSRLQKKINRVWRRRACEKCAAVFSSLEQVVYDSSIAVKTTMSHIVPFNRDLLYLSIYDACRHRKLAVTDATALTDTILSKLPSRAQQGLITRDDIVKLAQETLAHFDQAAAVHYAAFHPLP